MKSGYITKIALVVCLLIVAGVSLRNYFSKNDGISEMEFYYDLSEGKLFGAPRESLPPVKGINDAVEDAVRAVVISKSDNPDDESRRSIAYLEKYAPELKRNIEAVRAGKADPMPSAVRNRYRFVKRVEDLQWHAVNTPVGQEILNSWTVAGADGKLPIVCVP